MTRASAEAEAKAGYLSTDATDFADAGGDRKQWAENRARELDAQPGLGLGTTPTAPAAPAQPSKPAPKAPPLPKDFDKTMAYGVNTLLKGTPIDKFSERMRKMGYDDARINATIRFAEQVKAGQ